MIEIPGQTYGRDIRDTDPMWFDCACYFDCQMDSASGHFHQHEEEPGRVHPGTEVVG